MTFVQEWWDLLIFGILFLIHIEGWREIKGKLTNDPQDDMESKTFGASTLSSASVAGITAVSILIPASLLIIQLGSSPTPNFSIDVLGAVFKASRWFLLSLCLGLIVVFLIPYRCQKYNVARDFRIGLFFGPQLLTLLIGMIWLVIGIYKIVYS